MIANKIQSVNEEFIAVAGYIDDELIYLIPLGLKEVDLNILHKKNLNLRTVENIALEIPAKTKVLILNSAINDFVADIKIAFENNRHIRPIIDKFCDEFFEITHMSIPNRTVDLLIREAVGEENYKGGNL